MALYACSCLWQRKAGQRITKRLNAQWACLLMEGQAEALPTKGEALGYQLSANGWSCAPESRFRYIRKKTESYRVLSAEEHAWLESSALAVWLAFSAKTPGYRLGAVQTLRDLGWPDWAIKALSHLGGVERHQGKLLT